MCLSTVYKNAKEPGNVVMSNVQRIDVEEGQVLLTDVMDREIVVVGRLLSVDLVGGVAILKEENA